MTKNKEKIEGEDVPNRTTSKAIKELEQGKDAGEVCLDSLERFITSME